MIFSYYISLCLSDMMQITKNQTDNQTKVKFWAAE